MGKKISATDLSAMFGLRHGHPNITKINKIDEDSSGNMYYNGSRIAKYSEIGSGGEGGSGREVELRNSGTYIQWRYVGDLTWIDLVSVASLTGADGTSGNTILSGSGTPAVGTGVAGDFYLDTASMLFYGPKTTVWGTGTSLVGADGTTALDDNVTASDKTWSSSKIDGLLDNKQDNLGFTPEDSADKGVANGYAGLDTNGRLAQNVDANKIVGVLDISNVPAAAIEKLTIVANQTARYALTTASVQNGDTVKQTDTGEMWYVVDDTNLSNATGYAVYTAGSASAVPWTGVTGKPTTLSGYGITDAATSTHNHSGVYEPVFTTLPISKGGTNSGTALSNNRVMKSSGGAVVEAAAITASRALISDANGIPTHSTVTSTELGYLSGVTSAIQTQLGTKLADPMTTRGDIVYRNSSNVTARLALGTNGQVVGSNGTDLVWVTPTSGGTNSRTVSSKTAAYTVTTSDDFIVCDGTFTVTLFAVSGNSGKQIEIKNKGTGVISVKANASELMDDLNSIPLYQYDALRIMCDGTKWHIV